VTSTGSDAGVEQVLSTQPGEPFYPAWISYWTPAVPPVGTSLNLAGYAAGLKAGEEIETAVGAAGRPAPLYVGLDFEGSPAAISCGTKVKDPNSRHTRHKDGEKQCWDYDSTATTPQNCFIVRPRGWKAFALGWAAGVESYTTGGGYPASLTAAIYLNKTEYRDDHAGDWGLPVIVAIAPVLGGHAITGPGIVGYAAYGTEEHPATCKDAPADIDHVRDWGGISTIQFSRIGDDGKLVQSIPCTPGGKPA
jgi:hypothetical protein